jgi:hypothetical protein
MTRQTILRGALVLLFFSVLAEAAMANSGAAIHVFFIPGVAVFSPLLGLPVTMLAALLERPFVSWAGIRSYPLTHSIRANLLSWLAGFVFISFVALWNAGFMSDSKGGYGPVEWVVAVLFVLAIPVSILIEGCYYRTILKRQGSVLRWSPVIAANIVSNTVLAAMAVAPAILDPFFSINRIADCLSAYQWFAVSEMLEWILAAICLDMAVFAFWPLSKRGHAPAAASDPAATTRPPPEEVSPP